MLVQKRLEDFNIEDLISFKVFIVFQFLYEIFIDVNFIFGNNYIQCLYMFVYQGIYLLFVFVKVSLDN